MEEFVTLRKTLVFTVALLFILTMAAPSLRAQSLTTGEIAGTVTDPTGAVVPGATVTLKNNDQGTTQTRTTSNTGAYRFALLQPGSYTMTISSPNLQTTQRNVRVNVGQATTLNAQMALAAAQEAVTVTAEGALVQAQNPNISTTMSHDQVAYVPNGGNDLSYVAQTAPGAAMNTQSGFGNFSTFG
jgi:protocatechuate 3,4-dioxygenase beta subunit